MSSELEGGQQRPCSLVHIKTAIMKDEMVIAASLKKRGKLNLPSVALFLNALLCAFVIADKI